MAIPTEMVSGVPAGLRSEQVIYRCIVGSRAYGTAKPDSDTDVRGLFVRPARAYLDLDRPADQLADERGDIVYYSIRRFLELCRAANPGAIEMLFPPEDCIQHMSPTMRLLLDARSLFITKRNYQSHIAYAQAQIKRARGRNKWVNNPQPEKAPIQADYCWVLPCSAVSGERPYRPIPFRETNIDPAQCDCTQVGHIPGLYRLYFRGRAAAGIFRNGSLVYGKESKEAENDPCLGLFIFNRQAYDQAVRDHRHYWDWKRDRNQVRWLSQEGGEMDYDAKNMMHTIRLLYSGANILRHGRPLVRFEGRKLSFLKNILAGRYGYDELIQLAEEKVAELQSLYAVCELPDSPDSDRIETLLHTITQTWEADDERQGPAGLE